jgi:ATP-dependent protease ClpP protease subunit
MSKNMFNALLLKVVIAFFFVGSLFQQAYGIDLRVDEDDLLTFSINLSGKISNGDASTFESFLAQHSDRILSDVADETRVPKLRIIHSDGGNVEESLKIGTLIRKFQLSVEIPFDSHCYSSCIFLLAGGVDRYPHGKVGIHRPYFNDLDSKKTYIEIRNERDRINDLIGDYLKQVDVSEQILQLMLSVPPEEIKILSLQELEKLRLYGRDPTWDEMVVSFAAKAHGISSQEYRRRLQLAGRNCSFENDFIRCADLIMFGITEKEWQKKRDEFLVSCSPEFSTECFREIMRRQ